MAVEIIDGNTLEEVPGGFILNGNFIELDIDKIDKRAEEQIAAGLEYSTDEVMAFVRENSYRRRKIRNAS